MFVSIGIVFSISGYLLSQYPRILVTCAFSLAPWNSEYTRIVLNLSLVESLQ